MKIIAFPEQIQLNPRNYQDFGFVKDFRNPKSRVSLDFENLVLVNQDYEEVRRWIYERYGRFENIEATIIDDLNNEYQHYLDLSGVKFSDDEVEVGIQARKGTDHFFERAEGLTFEFLFQNGNLVASDFIDVPYLVVPNDLQLQRIVTIAITISTIMQLRSAIFEIAKLAADALDVVGTGVLTTIAKAIALAIYFTLTLIQLIVAFNQLKELYFPKIRYFKACSDLKLIQKGCQYLGFTLESQALTALAKIHTLPRPQAQEQSIFQTLFNEFVGYFNTGYPTAQDSCRTLWSLIEDYLTTYNLRIFVYNGIVKIEKRSTFIQNASVVIKPTFSDQSKRQRTWDYNDSEVFGQKYLHYAVDYTDMHSPDKAQGSQAEYISTPINVLNPDLVNLPGLRDHLIPFAWGGRKNSLNRIEQFVSGLFGLVDSLVNFFGGNGNLQAGVLDRIGVLVIEQQFFEQTKRLWLDANGKQPYNYQTKLSIDNIYLDYHTDLDVQNNCVRYVPMRIPFTMQKFNSLLQNNFVILDSGEVVELMSVGYKDRKYSADVILAIPDESAFNVQTIKLT